MAAGAWRARRTAQLLALAGPLARTASARVLSIAARGQRRAQSTVVADLHDAPQTGLQSGLQTGTGPGRRGS